MKILFQKSQLLYLVFFAPIVSAAPMFGQQDLQGKISAVEKNLMSQEIFLDSSLKRFDLYERMRHYKVPSVSIAVVQDGKIEWAKAYGLADVEENRPATTNTRYQCASISKCVNSLCVMKLVEEGKLSLYKDIHSYLKTWTFPDNNSSGGKKITLLNLLSHTAGLSVHGFNGYQSGKELPTLNQMLDGEKPANSAAVKPIYTPMTEVKYSGGGTLVIKKILADQVAKNYDSLLTETVLKPLHMDRSSFEQPMTRDIELLASGHYGYKRLKGKYRIYPEQAPDGLWSTPTDLAKFIFEIQKCMLPGGFLNDTLARRMMTPVMSSQEGGTVALGFFIDTVGTHPYFFHDGQNEGFNSLMAAPLYGKQGAVIMVNENKSGELLVEIYRSILDVYKWPGYYKRRYSKKNK